MEAINTTELPIVDKVGLALKEDTETASSRVTTTTEEPRLKSLPTILRGLGALVLVAATATFMLQHWSTMDHIIRYFAFLGFTMTLCAAGFFCGLKIKDDKGARTFLAVTAAVVPVHFCQLGALIYSRAGAPVKVHDLLTWVAPDLTTALFTTGIGLVALLPIILIAFSALARSKAKELTIVYLLANSILLLPTRFPGQIGLIALLTFTALIYFDYKVLGTESSLKTKEGVFSRALLFSPVAIILARSVNLYNVDELFFAALNFMLATTLFVGAPEVIRDKNKGMFIQGFSIIPAIYANAFFVDAVMSHFHLGKDYLIPCFTFPIAIALLVMSYYSIGSGVFYRRLAMLAVIGGLGLQLMIFPGITSSSLCICIGMISAAYGFTIEDRATLLLGLSGLILGLGYHLQEAVKLATYSPWVSLAVLGIGTIIASSYIEKNYREILLRVQSVKSKISSWS